jgi:hypothetical protein
VARALVAADHLLEAVERILAEAGAEAPERSA